MKYFLWINEKQEGPFKPEELHEMLSDGHITGVTLGRPEEGTDEWSPIKKIPGALEPAKSPSSAPVFLYKKIEESRVAFALKIVAILELIGAPIAGLGFASDVSGPVGLLVFVSGVISGLILLGFARVIEHLCESSQRLDRIETLILKAIANK